MSTETITHAARDLPVAISGELQKFFVSREALVAPIGPHYEAVADLLAKFVLRGGKRVRPVFAWLGWVGSGGNPESPEAPSVLTACASLELIQACALVHDDIIDNSDTRRGHPTVHVEFAAHHANSAWNGDADRFGVAAGIITGDLAFAWADDMFHGAGLPRESHLRAFPVWSAMRTEVLGGQLLDIVVEASDDGSLESAEKINRYKTAAYTVERPLHLGAAIAGANDELISAFRTYGECIGIAFQLRDDLLGVFGDPELTGKPSGDDLIEGKRTELLAHALKRADAQRPQDAQFLRKAIGTDLSAHDIDTIRSLLVDLGAVDAVEQRISTLTDRGLAALENSTATDSAKQQLHQMALTVTRRAF
nr:polyprenyl synthetase family protein [Hoyosella rhizosphaerae]